MIEGLTAALGEPIARRWRSTALGTASALWVLFAFLYACSHLDRYRCSMQNTTLCRLYRAEPVGPALMLLTAVCVVAGSAFVVAALAPRLFALLTTDSWLSGPTGVVQLGLLLIRWQRARRARDERRFEKYCDSTPETAHGISLRNRRTSARDAAACARWPVGDDLLRLSSSGNALAAAAQRVEDTTGLNLSVAWPPLVATLPQEVFERLAAQSTMILGRFQQLMLVFGALPLAAFLPWRFAWIWLVVGCIAALAFRRAVTAETGVFARQIHTTVVLHRTVLYSALGLPPPATPSDELAAGRRATEILKAFQKLGPRAVGTQYSW